MPVALVHHIFKNLFIYSVCHFVRLFISIDSLYYFFFICLDGCLSFSLPCLSLPCLFPSPAYFHALPVSLTCPFPLLMLFLCPAYFLDLAMPTSFCLCLLPMPISSPSACFLVPNSLPCLFPDLPMPTSFCLLLCLFPLPVSLPCLLLLCLFPLPVSLPCLLLCPAYRSTFFYECMLHGYIASHSLLIR